MPAMQPTTEAYLDNVRRLREKLIQISAVADDNMNLGAPDRMLMAFRFIREIVDSELPSGENK